MVAFAGASYDPKEDDERLLNQIARVYSAMEDGTWRTLHEIEAITNDPPASISAQLRHLRKAKFGGYTVNRRTRGGRSEGLYEYQVLPKGSPGNKARESAKGGLNGFQKGVIYAAKILVSSPDIETAKSKMREEILKIKGAVNV